MNHPYRYSGWNVLSFHFVSPSFNVLVPEYPHSRLDLKLGLDRLRSQSVDRYPVMTDWSLYSGLLRTIHSSSRSEGEHGDLIRATRLTRSFGPLTTSESERDPSTGLTLDSFRRLSPTYSIFEGEEVREVRWIGKVQSVWTSTTITDKDLEKGEQI